MSYVQYIFKRHFFLTLWTTLHVSCPFIYWAVELFSLTCKKLLRQNWPFARCLPNTYFQLLFVCFLCVWWLFYCIDVFFTESNYTFKKNGKFFSVALFFMSWFKWPFLFQKSKKNYLVFLLLFLLYFSCLNVWSI